MDTKRLIWDRFHSRNGTHNVLSSRVNPIVGLFGFPNIFFLLNTLNLIFILGPLSQSIAGNIICSHVKSEFVCAIFFFFIRKISNIRIIDAKSIEHFIMCSLNSAEEKNNLQLPEILIRI